LLKRQNSEAGYA